MSDAYQTETFAKAGPNGEALKLTVELHYDEDASPHNAEFVRERELRGPCYHIPSGTLFMETPDEGEREGLGSDSRMPTWANLGTECDYLDTPLEERRIYLGQEGERVRSYCYQNWHHCGVVATVETASGEVIGGSSCWGFESDDEELKKLESHDVAQDALYEAKKELTERHRAACAGIETETR